MCGVKNENHDFGKVDGLRSHKCLQSGVGKVWERKEWILALFGLSQVWWFWLDFVTWWCVVWKTKIMIFENWIDSILSIASKVMGKKYWSKGTRSWYGWYIANFCDFSYILWLVGMWGEKRKSWFWKSGRTQTSKIPPKWCGNSLGAKGIDVGMVGAMSSLVILVIWLDFVTWWCVGIKTKIMIF